MNKLGEYLYLGMGDCNGHRVCMSVAYKLDYCVKKALQFETASNGLIKFIKVNKIKTGELEKESSFEKEDLLEYIKKFS